MIAMPARPFKAAMCCLCASSASVLALVISCTSSSSIVRVDFCRERNWPRTAAGWQQACRNLNVYKFSKAVSKDSVVPEERLQQRGECLPVQGGEAELGVELLQPRDHVPGDVYVLPPAVTTMLTPGSKT